MKAPASTIAAIAAALLLGCVSLAHADEGAPAAAMPPSSAAERLQVAEPYIELHTGPGRGYPVQYVLERGQWLVVELRHTDWFRVRAEGGAAVGWVRRPQLEATLTQAGGARTFRDIALDDYLGRRVEFSGGWGHFQGDPMLRLALQYRLGDALGVELVVGQVQGRFSGTDFWHVDLVSEPWSDRRLSPYFAIGLGRFDNLPNASLVDAVRVNARLAVATLGLRWHLGQRYTARLDWSLHTALVSDQRSTEYRSLTAGIGFFF